MSLIVFQENAWKEEGGRIHASTPSTGMRARNLPVPEEFLHQHQLQQQQQHQRVADPDATQSHSSETLSALPSRVTNSSYSVMRHPFSLPRRGRADGRLSPSDPSNHSDLGAPSNDSEALLLPPPRSSTISPRLSANSRESAADGGSSSARQSSSGAGTRAFLSPLGGPLTPDARYDSPKYRQDSNSSRHSRESHENARTTRDRLLLRREAQDPGHLATKKNIETKSETRRNLDNDRRLMIGGGTKQQVGAWNGGMNNVLSKSSINISKDQELPSSAKIHEKPRLQKFRSDIDLTSKGLYYDNLCTRQPYFKASKSNTFTTSPVSIQLRPTHLSPQAAQVKGRQLLKSQSQPHFRSRNRKSEETNAASNQRRPEPEMDAKKTERVLEWLQDVDGFADPPESPIIFDSGPEQSDTAIHVVYQGD